MISSANFAAEDESDLIGLTEGAVGVQKSLAQGIAGNAAMENQVVAKLYLGKEQTMLAKRRVSAPFR